MTTNKYFAVSTDVTIHIISGHDIKTKKGNKQFTKALLVARFFLCGILETIGFLFFYFRLISNMIQRKKNGNHNTSWWKLCSQVQPKKEQSYTSCIKNKASPMDSASVAVISERIVVTCNLDHALYRRRDKKLNGTVEPTVSLMLQVDTHLVAWPQGVGRRTNCRSKKAHWFSCLYPLDWCYVL